MNFAEAVKSIPEIVKCLRKGLQALGTNSRKIESFRLNNDIWFDLPDF